MKDLKLVGKVISGLSVQFVSSKLDQYLKNDYVLLFDYET